MLILRYWSALPAAFSDLSEGRPAVEVLVDPEPMPEGLEFIDQPVTYAVKAAAGMVWVYPNPDGYAEVCPPELVGHVPETAWSEPYDGPGFFTEV